MGRLAFQTSFLLWLLTGCVCFRLREILNAQAGDKYKLSVNDFVVKASALALRDVPEVNAGWNDASIRQYNTIDISIAVAIDAGLITPIVKDADSKGLATISNEVKDLAFRAKKGKLLPAEYQVRNSFGDCSSFARINGNVFLLLPGRIFLNFEPRNVWD